MVGATGTTVSPIWFAAPAAACVGSFLATVAWRLPRGIGVASPRSACTACGATLGLRDLVPLASWLFLRGRCRHCRARIDLLYFTVEAAAVAVVLWSAAFFSGWMILASAVLGWTLITLSAIDLRHRILPDALALPLIALGLAVAWLAEPSQIADRLIGAAAGFAVFAAVALAYRALRGRDGLGMGDARLLAAAGAWTGWEGLPAIVLIAAASALAVTGLAGMVRKRRVDRMTEIAFGPYLAAGLWIVWTFGPDTVLLGWGLS